MELDLKTAEGKAGKGVIILIHGLGMNNYFWVDPAKCSVLGGLAPLSVFLADEGEKTGNKTFSFGTANPRFQGLWEILDNSGYSMVSWTQRQPLGPIGLAVAELQTVLEKVRQEWPGRPIYLIGHSRGGLVARRLLQSGNTDDIAGLITICSPHTGTEMAKFSRYLKPAGQFLQKMIPARSEATLTKALNRIAAFFESPAIEELTPGAEFIRKLQVPLPEPLRKLSFGGTSPALFHVRVRLSSGRSKVIRFPDLLSGMISSGHLPRELSPGHGDALVTAASAELPGSDHYNFPDNHVKAAYDDKIHRIILDFLQS